MSFAQACSASKHYVWVVREVLKQMRQRARPLKPFGWLQTTLVSLRTLVWHATRVLLLTSSFWMNCGRYWKCSGAHDSVWCTLRYDSYVSLTVVSCHCFSFKFTCRVFWGLTLPVFSLAWLRSPRAPFFSTCFSMKIKKWAHICCHAWMNLMAW